MEPTGNRPGSSLLARVFWIPAATLVAVELYARGFDGWGAWATAPLFLLPLALSLGIGAAGVREALREARSGELRASTVIFAVVAAAPFAWLVVRRHFV